MHAHDKMPQMSELISTQTQDPAELIEAKTASPEPVEPPRFDAAIVLGKNIGIGWHREQIQEAKGHLSDHSRMNVLAAGMMYKSGEAGKIIFSTGPTAGEDIPSEAALMKDHLHAIWPTIPDEDIILEDKSMQTKENALEVRKMLDEKSDIKNTALVTVGFHGDRARKLFNRAGVFSTLISSEDVVGRKFPELRKRYKKSKNYILETFKEKIGTPIQLYTGALATQVEKYVRKSRS